MMIKRSCPWNSSTEPILNSSILGLLLSFFKSWRIFETLRQTEHDLEFRRVYKKSWDDTKT